MLLTIPTERVTAHHLQEGDVIVTGLADVLILETLTAHPVGSGDVLTLETSRVVVYPDGTVSRCDAPAFVGRLARLSVVNWNDDGSSPIGPIPQ